MHRLTIREKREFYSGMARLMRAGTPISTALDVLARDTPRGLRQFLKALNGRIQRGEDLGDALLHQRPKVSELEASIVAASSRAGRLDHGCEQLSRYFEALERARRAMVGGMAYPLVMLHLTIFIIKINVLLTIGLKPYLMATAEKVVVIYGVAAGFWLVWKALTEAARTNVLADNLLNAIPGMGAIRQRFALARFFATLETQLEAQVNVWDAFANAARTSDSAKIIVGARKAIPMLRSGESLGEVLANGRIIPMDEVRSFRVAEQTGELDAELTQMAQRSEELAVAALARWSEWLPRLLYGCVLIYGGWEIVQWYSDYLSAIKNF